MSVNINIDNLRVRCGVLNLDEHLKKNKKVILTVNTREIDVFDITEEDIKYLSDVMEVAYYSENNTKVTNTSVRNSKYTKTFDLNVNEAAIPNAMKLRGGGIIQPYKLNLYSEGSFFSTHRDTARPGLTGTLVLILPTTYTGGEFVFSTLNVEDALPKDKLRFIYFDAEMEHSVNKVLSGHRITLVYNMFNKETPDSYVSPAVELSSIPQEVYDKMLNEAVKFCKNKKNVIMGGCKYRKDIFEKLKEDLSKRFKIIKVAVDVYNHDSKSISNIKRALEIDELKYANATNTGENRELKAFRKKTHKVDHVLFPSLSVLELGNIEMTRRHGKQGNKQIETHYEVPYYYGSLINPADVEKKTNVKKVVKKAPKKKPKKIWGWFPKGGAPKGWVL